MSGKENEAISLASPESFTQYNAFYKSIRVCITILCFAKGKIILSYRSATEINNHDSRHYLFQESPV